ncbi:hypothetical protein B8W95_14190, partial [Staphylococcus pasteuri]
MEPLPGTTIDVLEGSRRNALSTGAALLLGGSAAREAGGDVVAFLNGGRLGSALVSVGRFARIGF